MPSIDSKDSSNTNHAIDIAIIGGGIIALCCALQLQSRRRQVTIFEPNEPASGCSSGNAGHFATEQIIPLANPGTLQKLPTYLLSRNSPLSIKYRYLPKMIPWLTRFLCASLPGRNRNAILALSSLNQAAMPAWSSLLKDTRLNNMVNTTGSYLVMESSGSIDQYQQTLDTLRAKQVPLEVLDAVQVRKRLPMLHGNMQAAVYFKSTAHTVNPIRLGQSLANIFIQRGGTIIHQAVNSLATNAPQQVGLLTDHQYYSAKSVVIAAGAFSKPLAQQTGYKVPLETERGYHLMLPAPGAKLEHPITFYERQFIATPMDHGLRLAGTVEFGGLKLPPSADRAWNLYRQAKTLIPGLDKKGASSWMGFRPTLPDYLPVISQSPKNRNVLYAFGHQHLGLTQAAITGQLIADMISEEKAQIDIAPFKVDRFG